MLKSTEKSKLFLQILMLLLLMLLIFIAQRNSCSSSAGVEMLLDEMLWCVKQTARQQIHEICGFELQQ